MTLARIEVLGTGCAKCRKLEELTKQAATELGLDCEVVKVTSIMEIMERGVVATPALMADGKLLFAGGSPSLEKIKELLSKLV
ncbi:MAG: thioredoxin family protein [Synergistaceae bacterium]|nr:thioredoxin family protein [Synergistaceae bacterium]